ncbi:MAG: type I-E CRISPR-associated protein Cas6/Cse3/CasE, partial [Rhodospirillales bacterium]|nr:type I-E CRISPR-associated protein Cas6/Cse3/CasE [Rhodospirillales bacterium]
LYLVRVPMETKALVSWADERGWVRHRGRLFDFDEGRALHHLLDEALGPGLLRPFRLLVPPRRPTGYLYAYSRCNAEELAGRARCYALPDHLAVLRAESMRSKTMPEEWRIGQKLGFDLRVRPIRRLTRDLETANGRKYKIGAELDAFLLEALTEFKADPDGMKKAGRTREAVYLDWLSKRLAPWAALDRACSRMASFRRGRAARNGGVEGPDTTILGAVTISNATGFSDLLQRGVGRHCAYGYGMMLLRPPDRTRS